MRYTFNGYLLVTKLTCNKLHLKSVTQIYNDVYVIKNL